MDTKANVTHRNGAPIWRVLEFIVFALESALGLVGFYLVLAVAATLFTEPVLVIVGTLALIIVIIAFLILLHEVGHATVAWILGWRVRSITVLMISFRPLAGLWTWNPKSLGADLGGCVVATPPERGTRTFDAMLYALGGSAANIALGIFCLSNFDKYQGVNSTAFYLVECIGVLSFGLGILNLFPMKTSGGFSSDGLIVLLLTWRLLRSKRVPREHDAHIRLMADLRDGTPPFEDDLKLLDEIYERNDGVTTDFEYLTIVFAIREGNLERIRTVLLRMESRGVAGQDGGNEFLALASALLDRDPDTAVQYLDAIVSQKKQDSYPYWRCMAAVEHLRGNTELALIAVQRARSLGTSLDEDEEGILNAIESGTELPSFAYRHERRMQLLTQRFPPEI